jgi:hypothetical protein
MHQRRAEARAVDTSLEIAIMAPDLSTADSLLRCRIQSSAPHSPMILGRGKHASFIRAAH